MTMPSNRTSRKSFQPLSTPAFVQKQNRTKQKRTEQEARSADAARRAYLEERGVSFGDDSRYRKQRERKKASEAARVQRTDERNLVFYGRVSSSRGIKGSGDRRQGGNAVGICLKNKLGDPNRITSFFDYGVSGTKLNRPELDRLVSFIMEHPGCDLMVEDVDRLARDARVLLIVGGQLMNFGVRIWDINGEVSPEELMERGLRASADWRKITSRGNVDRRENIREGALYNKTTFGFRKPKVGKLVVDQKAAPLLKAMYQMALKERTFAHIARWLERRGVTNTKGERWSSTLVRETLEHKINAGWVVTQFEDGETVEFHHPELQIIDDDTFAAVNVLLNSRPVQPNKRAGLAVARNSPYALTGNVLCPVCGHPLNVIPGPYSSTHIMFCRRYKSNDCDYGERLRYASIERIILVALRDVLTPDFDALFLAKAKQEHELEHGGTDARRKELKAQIARLSRRIKAAFGDEEGDEDGDEDGDDEDFKSIFRGLKDDLRMKKDQLTALKSGYFFGYAASGLSSLPEEIDALISASPFVPQNEDELELARTLAGIIKNVVPTRLDDERVGIEFDLDFSSQFGKDQGTVVVHRAGMFEEKRHTKYRAFDALSGMDRDALKLTDKELARVLAIPGLAEHLSEFDDDTVRNAMDAIALAMQADIGALQATQAMGFDRYSRVNHAVSQIRAPQFALKFMDVMVELRGVLPGERRVAIRPRPRRRLRAKYLDRGHVVTTLRQTQLGAPDEPLSDEEWEVMRTAIVAGWGPVVTPGTKRQLKNYVRGHFDNLFKILREDAIVSAITGRKHDWTFQAAIRGLEKTGAFDLAVNALKQHQDRQ